MVLRWHKSVPVADSFATLPRARRSAWAVLGHAGFRLYFAGSLTSNLGTWMQNTAQVLLIYQLTHSVFAIGLVTCAQFSGFLLLGPWPAVVASRIGGKPMLICTQIASAAVAGALAVLEAMGSLGEENLIIGALGLGLLFTFALPVQSALIPRMIPDEDPRGTEAAMAMNSVSYNSGRAIAPILCVLVITTIGFTWAFALNALSFVIFAVILVKVGLRDAGEPALPTDAGDADEPARQARARDGWKAAVRTPRIMLVLAMVAAVTFADDPVLILGPALAHHVLHASSDFPGYFLSALGLGTVLGSLWPTRDPRSWGKARTSQRAARHLLCLAAAVVVFSLGISTWVSLAAAFVVGVASLKTGSVTQSQLVRLRPELAASVMALWAICWAGTKPLASLVDGWLASQAPHLWMAGVALTIPALVLGIPEVSMPTVVKRWLADRVEQITPPAVVDTQIAPESSVEDHRLQPVRHELANAPGTSLVTYASQCYRLTPEQLVHSRRMVSTTKPIGSPSHHLPVL